MSSPLQADAKKRHSLTKDDVEGKLKEAEERRQVSTSTQHKADSRSEPFVWPSALAYCALPASGKDTSTHLIFYFCLRAAFCLCACRRSLTRRLRRRRSWRERRARSTLRPLPRTHRRRERNSQTRPHTHRHKKKTNIRETSTHCTATSSSVETPVIMMVRLSSPSLIFGAIFVCHFLEPG
jgi:hypothetical protein